MKKRNRRRFTGSKRLQHIALHEAGHAVVADLLGILPVNSTLTIIPDDKGVYGSVSFSKKALVHDSGRRWGKRYTRKIIIAQYAGPAASKKLNPNLDLFEEGGEYESDMIFSSFLCGRVIGNSACEERLWSKAVALVDSNWSAITALAKALIEKRRMSGKEAHRILMVANAEF